MFKNVYCKTRIISVVLVMVTICTLFAGLSVNADAATSSYLSASSNTAIAGTTVQDVLVNTLAKGSFTVTFNCTSSSVLTVYDDVSCKTPSLYKSSGTKTLIICSYNKTYKSLGVKNSATSSVKYIPASKIFPNLSFNIYNYQAVKSINLYAVLYGSTGAGTVVRKTSYSASTTGRSGTANEMTVLYCGSSYVLVWECGSKSVGWVKKTDLYTRPVASNTTSSLAVGTVWNGTQAKYNFLLAVRSNSKKNGANVQVARFLDLDAYNYIRSPLDNYQWKFVYNSSTGFYTLYYRGSNYCLDVSGGGTAAKTNLQIYSSNNTMSQHFQLISAGNNYYYIRSQLGTYVSLSSTSYTNGRNVYMYTGNRSSEEKWQLWM